MRGLKKFAALVLMLCILATMLPQMVFAATVASGKCGENVTWNLDDAGVLTISGYGDMYDYYYWGDSVSPWYTEDGFNSPVKKVIIQNGVTSIGNYAFQDCCNIERVTIGNTVTKIGAGAFGYCYYLPLIDIPNNVMTIDAYAFADCFNLTAVNLPKNLEYLGSSAFGSCRNLKSIEIPQNITTIEAAMFNDCQSLSSVKMGSNVTELVYGAFKGCSALKSITLPDSVSAIYPNAFEDCTSLQSIVIPESVTEITYASFSGCTGLQNVTIPDTVVSIDEEAFLGTNIKKLIVADGSTKVTSDMIPSKSTLREVVIPNSVTNINEWAFEGCNNIVGLTIGNGLSIVENFAFYDCTNLKLVSYGGSKNQKENILINMGNDPLKKAEWTYGASNVTDYFADISTSSWQYTAAKYACDEGLMAGKGTDSYGRVRFDPNNFITREEFVQVLYNAEGKPSVNIANRFPDVKDSAWYRNAVLWSNSQNIANGMGNGNFGVGKNITRQDLAMMLYKYATMKGYSLNANSGEINKYADGNKVSNYAKTAMDWAVTNGVLSGKGVKGEPISTFKLDPAGTATRAECAAMLKNFISAFGS